MSSQSQDLVVIEGIVTTLNEDGSVNIAPMGPVVDRQERGKLILRPYTSSTTYKNLKRHPFATFHIHDDVLLLAESAIGRISKTPQMTSRGDHAHQVLDDACQWFALEVIDLDDRAERTTITCRVMQEQQVRPFLGFNRAKHAVLEATILATRIGIIEDAQIREELERLKPWVEKTGGVQEREAFTLIENYVDERTHPQHVLDSERC